MPNLKWGIKSKLLLNEVDMDIKAVLDDALKISIIDMIIIEGVRTKEKQDEYFNNGKSRVQWPNSKHNIKHTGELSRAVDVVPFINGRISWNKEQCCLMAGIILTCARYRGVSIRWGGNWDMDLEPLTDQDFQDLVHFEKVG